MAQLVLNLAGPAENFFYSLPDDRKETLELLRDGLKERFSNDNQSCITWQAVTTRQQGELELLDTYLTELTNNFRRLHITDAEKMRYFVQGLRSEIRKSVLMKQPKSFREAEKMARLACSAENAMNKSPENSVAAQIENLSQTVKSLLSAGVTPNAQCYTDNKKLLTVIEHNNALLANLSTALGKQGETTEPPRVKFTQQNNATTGLAALNNEAFIGKSEFQELKNPLLEKLDWLEEIKTSAEKYHVRGQERDSHAVLPVDELAILQSTAPNAESQALNYCLKNHFPLADLIISHITVIINHEIIVEIRHSYTDVI